MTSTHPGKLLRNYRQLAGLTLEAVADRAGMSKGYLSRIENMRVDVALDVERRIGHAIGELHAERGAA